MRLIFTLYLLTTKSSFFQVTLLQVHNNFKILQTMFGVRVRSLPGLILIYMVYSGHGSRNIDDWFLLQPVWQEEELSCIMVQKL